MPRNRRCRALLRLDLVPAIAFAPGAGATNCPPRECFAAEVVYVMVGALPSRSDAGSSRSPDAVLAGRSSRASC